MAILKRMQEQWDRCAAVVLVIVAAVALILGYNGVANTEFVAAQIPYFISGGVFGLLLLGAAGVLWLSADLRDEWVKLDRIEEHLVQIEVGLHQPRPSVPAASEGVADGAPAASASPARRRRPKAPA
jgi:hypothetical protein